MAKYSKINPKAISHQVNFLPVDEFYLNFPQFKNRLRWLVFRAKGYSCVKCGLTGTHAVIWHDHGPGSIHTDLVATDNEGDLVMITLDHHKPKSKGGSKTVDNLNPMCSPCNGKKGDKMPCSARNCYEPPVHKEETSEEEFCQKHMDQLFHLHFQHGKPYEVAVSILVD